MTGKQAEAALGLLSSDGNIDHHARQSLSGLVPSSRGLHRRANIRQHVLSLRPLRLVSGSSGGRKVLVFLFRVSFAEDSLCAKHRVGSLAQGPHLASKSPEEVLLSALNKEPSNDL